MARSLWPWRRRSGPAAAAAAPQLPPVFRNRIVGVVRFSFPALSGFARIPREAEAAKAVLYDPDRLERRFTLFEALTLPSIIAQTDADFQLGFLIGDDFPATYRKRLENLLARVPQAYLFPHPPAPNFRATHATFKGADLGGATHLTSFRLDDDDALDRGFIARLRHQAASLYPMCRHSPYVISQNRGFYAETGEMGGDLYDVQERTPIGIGVALVAGVRSGHTVFIYNHRDLAERYNAYADAVTPAFVRSVHRDNDAKPHVAGSKRLLDPGEVRDLIARHFPFTVDDLKRL
ncbi:MAG: putative rhamnosyl transferase [Pararhodobacter sp.]|nr:putative rhamnosyl transferase [Pararhodobacter sp.]